MAKSLFKIRARKLREAGESVKSIAKQLGVSKSTASMWVKDIILSVDQLEYLRQKAIKGAERGRLQNAFRQKEKRRHLVENSKREGINIIGNITNKELLMTGLALYWGEGSKKQRRVELCNSDPKMIQFFLHWLHQCFGIKTQEIRCYVGINAVHADREQLIKQYWSQVTKIPLGQFTKTSFKKVKNIKIYENFEDHFGTLSVRVTKPSRIYYKILGLIEGIHANVPG